MSPAGKRTVIWALKLAGCQLLLFIVIFAIWRIHLAHRVTAKLVELRAAGLPTNGSELNSLYPDVPDSENAALVVTQAISTFHQLPHLHLPKAGKEPTAEQLKKIELFLGTNHTALTTLQRIQDFKKSHYPIDCTPGDATLLPHLRGIKEIANLLTCQTIDAVERKDGPTVAHSITLQLALAHTLDSEPLLISKLISGNVVTGAVRVLNFALDKAAIEDTNLSILQKAFGWFGSNGDLSVAYEGDLAMTLPDFQKKWRDASQLFWTENGYLLSFNQAIRGTFGRYTGLFDQDEIFFIGAMQDAIDDAKQPYPMCLASYDKIYQTAVKGYHRGFFMGPMRLAGLRIAVLDNANSMALARAAQTALAIEQFRVSQGKLPENLKELVPQFLSAVPEDPFDGELLGYHHLERGYVVYSIGWYGEDNGGHERPTAVRFVDKINDDVAFTVER